MSQPAEGVVGLPEGELVYAERINEYLEGDPVRLREQQRTPRVSSLGAGHAGIDNRVGALLKHHGDAQIASNLEAVHVGRGNQKLPRGEGPYGLTDLLFGRHLVEKVDDSINSDHFGQRVTPQRHGSGAHQVEHCVNQARWYAEILGLGHGTFSTLAGTRHDKRRRWSPTLTSTGRAATTFGSVQSPDLPFVESCRRAAEAPVSLTHTCELPNSPRPRPRPGPGTSSSRGSSRNGPRNRRTRLDGDQLRRGRPGPRRPAGTVSWSAVAKCPPAAAPS